MNNSITTGIFTLLGVILGSLATFMIASRTARLEHQRHLRELGLKIALANFDFTRKQAETIATNTNQITEIHTLPIFVAEGIRIAEILGDSKLNDYDLGKRLSTVSTSTKTIVRAMKEQEACQNT
jgi:hypothetical protein